MLVYKVLCDPTSVCLTPIMSHVPLIYSAPATLALFLLLKPAKLIHSCLWIMLQLFPLPINFLSLTLAWSFPSCHSAYKRHFSERPFLTPSINLSDYSYHITLIFYSHCAYSIILIFYCSLIFCLSSLKYKLHKKRSTLSYSLLYAKMEKDA